LDVSPEKARPSSCDIMCIIKIKSRNQDFAGSPFYRSAVAFCQNVKDFSFRGCSIWRFLGRIFWAIRTYGYTPRWGLTTAVISGTPRHLDSPTSCQAKINKSKINAFYMVPIVDVFFVFCAAAIKGARRGTKM